MHNQPPYRRQLRNYLLNRAFQLRYTLVIVLTSAVLTGGLGYFWYDEMRTASRIIEVQSLSQTGAITEADISRIQDELRGRDRWRLGVLVGFGVLLALVLAVYGIVFTHKVAGPLFKAQRYFQSIAAGDLQRIPNLRKGDQLRDFWAEFRLMQEALRERAERDVELLEGVIAAMEASADAHTSAKESVQEQIDQLRALCQRVRDALQGKAEAKADASA